jgi:hypothetical protein
MAQFILPYSTSDAPLGQIAVAQTIAAPTSTGNFTCPGGGGWRIIAMLLSVDTGVQVGAWNGTVVALGGALIFPNNADRVGLADGEWSPVPNNNLVGGQTYTFNAAAVDAAAITGTVYVLLQKKDAYCA